MKTKLFILKSLILISFLFLFINVSNAQTDTDGDGVADIDDLDDDNDGILDTEEAVCSTPIDQPKMGFWGNQNFSETNISFQLTNSVNYSSSGTYSGVTNPFVLENFYGDLTSLTADQLKDKYDIINIGTNNLSEAQAQKVYDYVALGGTLLHSYGGNGNVGFGTTLMAKFGFTGVNGSLGGAEPFGTTSADINNGVFGDVREALNLPNTLPSGNIASSQLPSGAITLGTINSNGGVAGWVAGPPNTIGGRAVFIFDELGFLAQGTTPSNDLDKYLNNIVAYLLDQTNQNSGSSGSICDTDGDGIPNSLDLDSDNDGIYDIVEAGTGNLDGDNDGKVDNFTDTDTNGLDDAIETSNGAGVGTSPIETTLGTADYLNLDSDADGCSDANEAYNDANADNEDGNADGGQFGAADLDPVGSVDANGLVTLFGIDYTLGTRPEVTDGDFNSSVCFIDPCTVGAIVGTPTANDPDADGIINECDLDDDNDGILDTEEAVCSTPIDQPKMGFWGNQNFSETNISFQLTNSVNYSSSGTYSGVTNPFVLENFYGDLTSLTADQLKDKYDIINIGTNNLSEAQAQKVYDYVALGGTLLHSYGGNGNVGFGTTLMAKFGFTGVNGSLGGAEPFGTTSADINNGVFGDVREALNLPNTLPSGNIASSQLPSGAITLGTINSNGGVAGWVAGPPNTIGGRAVFIFDELGFLAQGTTPSNDLDKYLNNIVAYLLDQTNQNSGSSGSICDTDGDGIPNSLDLDSDNDGIYDIVEAGTGNLDGDNDGKVDNFTDTDTNGLDDAIETSNGAGVGTSPIETTLGTADYLNLDSDADGCSDANEAYNDANADNEDGNADGGQFGAADLDPVGSVDANGLVTLSGIDYTLGTNAKVIDGNFISSVCSCSAGTDGPIFGN